MQILRQDQWLQNSVVLSRIEARAGRFWVLMIFVDSANPFRLIIRAIDHYPNQQKAEFFANILKRGIRRDPRGTLKLDFDAFRICAN